MTRPATLSALALGACALGFLAASPALAFSHQTAPAPHGEGDRFTDTAKFAHFSNIMPGSISMPYHDPAQAKGDKTIVYRLPPGKPAARIDVTNPRDNPFMSR